MMTRGARLRHDCVDKAARRLKIIQIHIPAACNRNASIIGLAAGNCQGIMANSQSFVSFHHNSLTAGWN
jgi:hypothetical protein